MVKTIEGKLAVLVIDVQNEFVDPKGSLYCEGGPDIIPQVNRITEAARKAGAPVIFTQEFHRKEEIDFGRNSTVLSLATASRVPGEFS
jgi:Amidases related to nicotinamidase